MKDMLYHTQAVAQATSQALLISDMLIKVIPLPNRLWKMLNI
ncbi:hypothetical protein BSPWISOXPB_5673 [uncultured Gammaproteobacteria bacterium]|nr:hypothetical protein BSPWISOXPB_5673 [uncultured Gammaproteobacteria bacterium]